MYNSDESTYILGAYLPDGKAFEAKNVPSTNTYKFIDALAKSFILFANDLEEVYKEMNPATTENLISRWENEYGMAQSCLGIASTLEERRSNLLIRIGMDGVQTVDDFEALAQSLGIDCVIHRFADIEGFPFTTNGFPITLATDKYARFTIIVDLPTELNEEVFPFSSNGFPIILLSELSTGIIECVFNKLVPVNVNVTYRYIL